MKQEDLGLKWVREDIKMPVCSFCKKTYKEPRGLTIFTFDGRSVHYCSSKCRRNTNLNRDPKKVNWIKKIQKKSKKELREEKIEKIKELEK